MPVQDLLKARIPLWFSVVTVRPDPFLSLLLCHTCATRSPQWFGRHTTDVTSPKATELARRSSSPSCREAASTWGRRASGRASPGSDGRAQIIGYTRKVIPVTQGRRRWGIDAVGRHELVGQRTSPLASKARRRRIDDRRITGRTHTPFSVECPCPQGLTSSLPSS